ncbi:uncharacterized protein LOC132068281 isoform X2 [Lycium ferocissimum]|uniref:uncharacterized protein LOC132068281 isoform X2 n=1 Tax=Lycium ferocissimum TaxID=112874 RepID=UPI002815AFD6|nr:uncharacterized protein LOC132068281 isoform X2 [Lycium ferocissimum]
MTYNIYSSSTVHHHHPSVTTTAAISGEKTENNTVSLKRKKSHSPPLSSPKRVTLNSPITAFSPLSKRVSDKSPFSTNTTNAMVAPPLPLFSRFTTTTQPNSIKNLRRTLSEPPVFKSFTDFCHYINSQSPENDKNINSISVKSQRLPRSISAPTDADILVVKGQKELLNEQDTTAPDNEESNSDNSEILKQLTNEDTASDKDEDTSNNSEKS